MAIPPEVLWAQRSNKDDETKNVLFVTVKISDSKNTKVDLTSTHLNIESDSDETKDHYKLNLEFYKEVDPEQSHHHTSGNSIYFVIRKKEKQEEFWPRITKEKLKYHYIKTDFDKWVDEDEQDEKATEDELAGMGGPPGFGGGANESFNMNDLAALQGLAGGQGGAGGAPDFSQLANLAGGAGGDFDFSKLAAGAGPVDPQTTEADFSSSDEEDQTEEVTEK